MPTQAELARLTPAQREDYEERAAILEYDAQLPRRDAEAQAYQLVQWQRTLLSR